MAQPSKDFDVRCAVVRHLLARGVKRARIRHEITLDTNSAGGRADVVVAHADFLACIEIKSGADKLKRLEDQVTRYRSTFDYTTVVVDVKHRDAMAAIGYIHAFTQYWCPDEGLVSWMGCEPPPLLLQGWNRSKNTSLVYMACLLWAVEAKSVAARLGYVSSTRHGAINWMRENATLREARPLIIEALIERQPNRWEESFWAAFDAAEKAEPRRVA